MKKLLFGLSMLVLLNTGMVKGQLVLPGDYPDPSVTKVGDTYWASATTSNWAPVYPLLSSKDLINWETKGFIFTELPKWADYYFWAPEITYEKGKVFVYYTAHKKGGNLCLAIATADKPEGPYKDLGPVMCEEVGSIDGFPMRDENGKLHIIWKEDGNSVGKPTPIWISEMKEDRTGLIGEKKELFRNEEGWEGNLVEGVSMIKHGEYFYAFYAAAACCGRECSYVSGVARSKKLMGPWEKFPGNPILDSESDSEWKCPGHGTPIERNGKYYFLYHAYNRESNVYAGRQGLLREFRFTEDGWIEFPEDKVVSSVVVPSEKKDDFNGSALSTDWQWSVFQKPLFTHKSGVLELKPSADGKTAFLGLKVYDEDFRAQAELVSGTSTAETGIAIIGDDENMVGASLKGGELSVWKMQAGKDSVITKMNIKPAPRLFLQAKVIDGNRLIFSYSTDGSSFTVLNIQPVDGTYLPPWDRAIRAGLISRGQISQKSVFENFILYH